MKPFLKFGLITSVAVIIWSMIMYLTEAEKSDTGRYLAWVSYIIMVVFMVLAMNEQKQINGGYLNFGEGFKTGLFMTLIISVVITVWTFLYFNYINPEIVDFIKEKAIRDMAEKGLTEEQIDQSMNIAGKFMTPNVMTFFALFGNVIFGTLLALIIAAIVKKEKPVFEDNI